MALTTFDFRGHTVRTAGTFESPLFCAADVCAALGIEDTSRAVSRLDDDDVELIRVEHATGGKHASFVTEAGLYQLVLGSRKPQAREFKKWVTGEVIPEIRKRGYYSLYEHQLKEQREKLLAEHFPNAPGYARPLISDLIGVLLRRFGWCPARGGARVARRGPGAPPWSKLLASLLYHWSLPAGQQERRRELNPVPPGESARLQDHSTFSDVAREKVREVCIAGIAIAKGAGSWEDWKHRMELAFGSKELQMPIMVPMLLPPTSNDDGEAAE